MNQRLDIERIARGLGAKRRGRVVADSGVWGAVGLAAEVAARFKVPVGGGRPTEPRWTQRRLVPLAPRTLRRLSQVAVATSRRAGVRIQPMQLAGLLLEETTARITEPAAARLVARRGT